MRMIAAVSVAAGNCTVKVVVEVLSEPKSRTQTVGLPEPDLYINAPRAVKAEVQVTLLNDR
jgi:hypothetical protein